MNTRLLPYAALLAELRGSEPVALTLGARYYAAKPDDGPDWGIRFAVIFLFPKK